MYQMQSIITACQSSKLSADWFRNTSTQEIEELLTMGFPIVFEKCDDLPNGLRGYYIHRLLVNNVATFLSPKYSLYIAKLLDSIFEQEREQQQKQIDNLTPRAVP